MAFLSKAKTVIYFKDLSIKIPSVSQFKYTVLHGEISWLYGISLIFRAIFYNFLGTTNKKDEISVN
jgi:hypothetical protein